MAGKKKQQAAAEDVKDEPMTEVEAGDSKDTEEKTDSKEEEKEEEPKDDGKVSEAVAAAAIAIAESGAEGKLKEDEDVPVTFPQRVSVLLALPSIVCICIAMSL